MSSRSRVQHPSHLPRDVRLARIFAAKNAKICRAIRTIAGPAEISAPEDRLALAAYVQASLAQQVSSFAPTINVKICKAIRTIAVHVETNVPKDKHVMPEYVQAL
jgi:hypothetical protein